VLKIDDISLGTKSPAQLSLGWTDRTVYRPISELPASDFRLWKESDFSQWLKFHTCCEDAAWYKFYWTLQ